LKTFLLQKFMKETREEDLVSLSRSAFPPSGRNALRMQGRSAFARTHGNKSGGYPLLSRLNQDFIGAKSTQKSNLA